MNPSAAPTPSPWQEVQGHFGLSVAALGPPAWLAQFESEARVALAQYGPDAQARLAVRRAGLLAEARAVEQLFSGVEIGNLVDE